MSVNKRSKNSRQRGSKTHGWGAMKKHRGAGNRGGRGMAGTGKRGDAKKPSIWKNKKYFGKYGFKKKGVVYDAKSVNIFYIEENLEKLLANKLVVKEGDVYVVDLGKLGFNKLLGSGRVTKKFKIITDSASSSAVEEIKKNGGEVLVK